ncbi:50S ribosomal protein L35 [Candidatus Beckwithbacteria bacterium CG10_big_fil_rev_8_21_14_0_10_34_10]|uniref:Large ribosomal subunit protein bL35 n=1 Tax=Candidatus Beckwithbacteria bacterium CG10_big_fil_rev_8_21_14_0_10_34_10 TaxID=1974495 RepID=A0A2H0WAG9_9BACT|nr:MAG: 50S ribosomal protein L35 [Candidatus Beckwithbacteria bacterium CG10_big_fil_rev_8_21_14_0_10_34_10]
MPKQKTRKSVKKRFKVSKTGKLLRRGSCGRHLNAKKSQKRRRRQKKTKVFIGKMAKKIRKVI